MIASGITKVNLDLDAGEFVVITGESGSGKSTLLNVISGLDTYEEGEMYIEGMETSHYTAEDFEAYRQKYIDEPTGNLDSVSAEGIVELLTDISADKLVIVVTHNYDQFKDHASRVIKMHDGKIVEDTGAGASAAGKEVELSTKAMYYEEKLDLMVMGTYGEKTFEKKTGLKNLAEHDGEIYINPVDYRGLYEKGSFQTSVFVDDTKNMAGICRDAGIPADGQHSLRHTFATRCIESGIPPVVLKNWLGHTDIHITLDTYTDVLKAMDNSAVSTFDQYIEKM